MYDYSAAVPLAATPANTLNGFRLRYFEEVCTATDLYPFAQIVDLALSEKNLQWTIAAESDGPHLVLTFHRQIADWEVVFRLLKDHDYLVAASQMIEEGKMLYKSDIQYRSFDSGEFVPESWRQEWYEAYLGPVDGSSVERSSNKLRRARESKIVTVERKERLKCEDIDWRMVQLPEKTKILRTTTQGETIVMQALENKLVPSELTR